jgi:hypothetical protein
MKFVETKRFSPVAQGIDLPWEEDYFHLPSADISDDFLISNNYIIDEEWWDCQYKYCIEGFSVPNSIEPGGDMFIDGIDAIWNETEKDKYNEEYKIVIPKNSCYLPNYKLFIYNRELHISGRLYWYLNFWPIYGLRIGEKIKSICNPRFLDMDFLFSRRIEMMFEEEKDSSELKRRQAGFSEKAAGMILAYNYTFVPASVNIVVSGEKTDAEHTMENALRGLDNLKNTQFYKTRAKGYDSKDVIKSRSNNSEIRCVTAKDNPQCLSRYTPFFIIYEEIGKWASKLILETKEFVNASTKAETIKTGFSMFIGTGGDMEAGAADFEKLHYNPDTHNLLKFKNVWEEEGSVTNVDTGHFTPAYWYTVTDSEGNSLKEPALEYLNKELKKRDYKGQFTFKTQFPVYASEAFRINTGGFFGKQIIELLNLRKAFIQTHKEAQVTITGRLEWIDRKNPFMGVKFIEDPDGWLHITEPPDTDENGNVYINLYKAATDSYDQDEATTDSMGSCSIWKGFNNEKPMNTARKWVARITERPSSSNGGAEMFYEHTAMVCIYYGMAINLIEYSKIRIIDWYIKNGFENLLKERPEFVSASMITKSKTTNRYGIDPSTKPHWLYMLRDEMTEDFINRMDDVYQIERLAKFRYDPTGKKYNCDTTITSALTVVLDKDEVSIMVSSEKESEKEEYSHYKTDANGRMVAA